MKCKTCDVELKEQYLRDINAPIGLSIEDEPIPRIPDYLWCPKCGLMYHWINER